MSTAPKRKVILKASVQDPEVPSEDSETSDQETLSSTSSEKLQKKISRIQQHLSGLLREVRRLEELEKLEREKEKKVNDTWSKTIGKAFFDSTSLFPLKIWQVTVLHRLAIGRLRAENGGWRERQELKSEIRARGTYFLREDAYARAEVLRQSAIKYGKVVDEEAEKRGKTEAEEDKELRWAMVGNTEIPGTVQSKLHQISCYVQRINVVGPAAHEPDIPDWDTRDLDSEGSWGVDSEADEERDRNPPSGISSAALEYVHDSSDWPSLKSKKDLVILDSESEPSEAQDSSEENNKTEFELERILEARINDGELYYKVKWKDSSPDSTWYNAKLWENAVENVAEFYRRNPKAPCQLQAPDPDADPDIEPDSIPVAPPLKRKLIKSQKVLTPVPEAPEAPVKRGRGRPRKTAATPKAV